MTKPSFILLTHEREFDRPTSSVRCCEQILDQRLWQPMWQRKAADVKLIKLISNSQIGLLYPSDDADMTTIPASQCDHWLILDGTWQEARKIYNRSPYLKNLPRIEFNVTATSQYLLRRNQKPEGLSTAECIIQLLRLNDEPETAEQINAEFLKFNTAVP